MTIWQYIVIGFLVLGFFRNLKQDFYGREEREPYGFSGAIITILITAFVTFVYFKAGLFD